MILFGLPGCGKSVLLRLIMGLEFPTEGQLLLRGEDAGTIGAGARNIGYVPQSFALFPHLSVYKNIAYPLTLQKKSLEFIDEEVHRVAKMLSIENLLGKKAIIVDTPTPPTEPLITYADVTKARRALGYEPKTQVEEGLKHFIEWMKAERII
jgi:ABC-type polar amino acid transport system ATPase subunit